MKEINFNKLAGEKIRQARTAKNMSEQDLAYSLDPDNYEETTKLIKYWEKGNGFPDLNQIYKLAELLEIDPNELYFYRENGRKQFKGKKGPLTEKQFNIKRIIERNIDDFVTLFPVFGILIIVIILLQGPTAIWDFFKKLSHWMGFV